MFASTCDDGELYRNVNNPLNLTIISAYRTIIQLQAMENFDDISSQITGVYRLNYEAGLGVGCANDVVGKSGGTLEGCDMCWHEQRVERTIGANSALELAVDC